MTTITDKELIKEIKEHISSLGVRDNIERRVYEIALTALTAEPFATIDTAGIELVKYGCNTFICPDNSMDPGNVPLYIGLPRIEPASQTAKLSFQEWLSEQKEKIDVDCGCVSIETLTHWMKSAYEAGNSPVTPDGLSTVCAETYQVVGVMADALGVFGDAAVQKVLDNLSQQKLVHRDVLPFSLPVTPDGWISCSERMPDDGQWCVVNTEYGYYVQCWSEGQGWLGDDISIPECDVINWMPLPEPPQEVNRG
ncbi:DUF551 domain-containing protein [Escherichia coli]